MDKINLSQLLKEYKDIQKAFKEHTREKPESIDLEYMNEVEAAMHRTGSPWAYRMSIGVLCFFMLFFVWACWTNRDEIVKGSGHIVLSRGVQPIQSQEGGIITDIFVKENQEVERGEVLARLSNIQAIAEYHDLLNKEVEYTLTLIRLTAEENDLPLLFTTDQQRDYPNVVRDQKRLFESRSNQYDSEGRELEAQLEQRRLEAVESQRRRAQVEKSLYLLKQQESRVRPLVGRSYSEVDYLNLRQRIVSQEGDLNSLAQTISKSQSAVREAEERLRNRDAERDSKNADEMNKYRQELGAVKENIEGRKDRVMRTDLRAPMHGVVKRIVIKQDGVARSAETIMEVLPLEDTLEVIAKFHPKDRGFLFIGQKALIKISAYDYSKYGGLDAEISGISADTIEDNQGQPWYEVRLQTFSSVLPKDETLEMKLGMTVEIDVLSGKKSIFNYLMKPLVKTRLKQNVVSHEVSPEDDNTRELPEPNVAPDLGSGETDTSDNK